MNYLALVNRARRECGSTGSGTALGTLSNIAKSDLLIAGWVATAWEEIQTEKDDWLFMRSNFEFTTTAFKQTYTAAEAGLASTFASWKVDSMRVSTAGQSYADEQMINFLEWNTFRNLYQYGNMRTTYSRPVVLSVTPAKALALGATPNGAYLVDGEYYTLPTVLAVDTDVPTLPDRFHMLVVYRAMEQYGAFYAAPEVLSRGKASGDSLMSKLLIDQLPAVTNGPPLA